MGRREFIAGLGGAVAWPLAARGQRVATPVQPLTPVIGVLWGATGFPMPAFRQGLADAGFVVDKNVTIELREAGLMSQLRALANDLVQRQVNVIFTAPSLGPFRAAKSATATIPIVFSYRGDPVKDGLVSSLAHLGGNVTGITSMASEISGKRVDPLHQLVPDATRIGFLSACSNKGLAITTLWKWRMLQRTPEKIRSSLAFTQVRRLNVHLLMY